MKKGYILEFLGQAIKKGPICEQLKQFFFSKLGGLNPPLQISGGIANTPRLAAVSRRIHNPIYSLADFSQLLINKILDNYSYDCLLVICHTCGRRYLFLCCVTRTMTMTMTMTMAITMAMTMTMTMTMTVK